MQIKHLVIVWRFIILTNKIHPIFALLQHFFVRFFDQRDIYHFVNIVPVVRFSSRCLHYITLFLKRQHKAKIKIADEVLFPPSAVIVILPNYFFT